MAYQFENLNILCVDDNQHMHQIYWISLSSMGFRKVKFAHDGEEALEMMRVASFDLIFCDLNMTPMNGTEFVQTLRQSSDPAMQEIPVIIVSGNTEHRRVCEARDVGATEFLAKPISIQDLYSRIRAVIEKPRAFTNGGSYTGPDRRRRSDTYAEEDRRSQDDHGTDGSQGEAAAQSEG